MKRPRWRLTAGASASPRSRGSSVLGNAARLPRQWPISSIPFSAKEVCADGNSARQQDVREDARQPTRGWPMTQHETEKRPPRKAVTVSTDRAALLWMYCREIAPYETSTFSKNVGELIAGATSARQKRVARSRRIRTPGAKLGQRAQ